MLCVIISGLFVSLFGTMISFCVYNLETIKDDENI